MEKRNFRAAAPDRLWVADLTYVRTFTGWVYVAFLVDVFSRRILGWQLATHLRTSLAFDALDMAIWNRKRDPRSDLSALVHHSDELGLAASCTRRPSGAMTPSAYASPTPDRPAPLWATDQESRELA